jgi:DNA-binding beta-propeller fold protein YncE
VILSLRGYVDLPAHASGGFDHGDVHLASGRVFVAHTATGTIEVIDGERRAFVRTLGGCPEASGVLCAQDEGIVFAAARGAGAVLVLDAPSCYALSKIAVGSKPNGLAWDMRRRQLLVADVADFVARLVEPGSGDELAAIKLPGRPRWCVYDAARDRFLVNILEPACVAVIDASRGAETAQIPIAAPGPHGLDLAPERERAYVACDGGQVVVLDLTHDRELGRVPIGGAPDAVWYGTRHERLYVAIGQPGLVDVVDCGELRVDQRVQTEPGAHTTAYDRARGLLYVFLPASGRAAVLEEVDDAA